MGQDSVFADQPLLRHPGKPTARFATVASLPAYTATATTLTANVNGAFPTTDGVVPVAGNVVFVILPGAASRADTGLYTITQLGTGALPWILTRHSYASRARNLVNGSTIFVREGTALGRTLWRLVTTGTITVGTTNLDWVPESSRRGVQSMPNRFHRMVRWQKDTGAATGVASSGSTATPTAVGTATRVQDATGDYIDYASVATNGSTAGWHAGFGIWRPDRNPRFRASFETAGVITVLRLWCGMTSADIAASADPASSVASIRFDTGAGDANFMVYTNDGVGGGTATSSGIAPVASTRYEVEIECVNGGAAWLFWINNAFAGMATANLPSVATNLGIILKYTTLEDVTKNLRIEVVEVDEP